MTSHPSPQIPGIIVEEVKTRKIRSRSMIMDDTAVDYTSLMGMEDRRRRFSEDVVDIETKETVIMQKLFRKIQRQVYCKQEDSQPGWLEKGDMLVDPLARGRSLSVLMERGEAGETGVVAPSAGAITIDDFIDVVGACGERSSSLGLTYTSVKRESSTKMTTEKLRRESLRQKKNQKRATAIVTSGALTFIVLAATMVTASFLMSPVIEEIFGKHPCLTPVP